MPAKAFRPDIPMRHPDTRGVIALLLLGSALTLLALSGFAGWLYGRWRVDHFTAAPRSSYAQQEAR